MKPLDINKHNFSNSRWKLQQPCIILKLSRDQYILDYVLTMFPKLTMVFGHNTKNMFVILGLYFGAWENQTQI